MDQYKRVLRLWESYSIRTATELDKYLVSFWILFAYHSGKIENEEITYIDAREIFENSKVLNYTGNPRTLFELQNQKLCYDFLKENVIKKEPLSIDLMKETHECLQKYDRTEALDSMYEFFKFETVKTWTKALELAEGKEEVRKGLSDYMKDG